MDFVICFHGQVIDCVWPTTQCTRDDGSTLQAVYCLVDIGSKGKVPVAHFIRHLPKVLRLRNSHRISIKICTWVT